MKDTWFKVSYDELADLLETEFFWYTAFEEGKITDQWARTKEADEYIAEQMTNFEEIDDE